MTIIELEPVDFYCRHCDSAMEPTGCDAPRCLGHRCLGCGHGCDLLNDLDGNCAVALATVPHDDYRRFIRTVYLPGDCS